MLQGSSSGNVHLRFHDIDRGNFLGHSVFHLHTRVHFNEDVLAVFVDKKLDRTGTLIIDVFTEPHRVGTNLFPQLCIQKLRRSNFNNFLVTTLQRAVALIQVHHVAMRIGQDLHLNVLWLNHRGF